MKGKNTLHLNQATMIEALQVWLDKTLLVNGKATVKSVRHASTSGSFGGGEEFEVTLESPSEEATP